VTRRDWWIGVIVLSSALVFHAAVPRYTWRTDDRLVREDRWTGRLEAFSSTQARLVTIDPDQPAASRDPLLEEADRLLRAHPTR
jgi:hypothetical protein